MIGQFINRTLLGEMNEEGIELEETIENTETIQEEQPENQEEPFLKEVHDEEEKEEKIESSKPFRPQSYLLIFIFIIFYIGSDLLLPLYNKLLFNGFGSLNGFHYPVTTSLLQVGIVGFVLFIYEILKHILQKYIFKIQKDENWIFSNFLQKM